MGIVDFHAHILPGIDDGSRNVRMSEQMLKLSAVQGVEVIVATPHFYADRISLDGFLKKRKAAWHSIQKAAKAHGISVVCGAEVALFPGMSRAEGLEALTFSGGSFLLLEMPFRPWKTEDLREVDRLLSRGICPVIAHLERYRGCRRGGTVMEELLKLPVLVQVNAEALTDWRTSRFALKLFREGKAHLLGSDCHNLTSRPPNLVQGRKIIQKKLGKECLERMDRLGEKVLNIT